MICNHPAYTAVRDLPDRWLCGCALDRVILGRPVPRQEFAETGLSCIGDAREGVGEPGLWIDVVELGRRDQRQHEGAAIGAAL